MERTDSRRTVFARSEVDVLASPRRVWAVLADIDGWHTWNPAVREASLDGSLEAATSFRFAAGPGSCRCVLDRVDAPRTLTWSGRSMSVGLQHSWHIEPLSVGCHVRTEQSLSGILARLMSGRLQRRLEGSLDTWLHLLKLEAEARSNDDADGPGTDGPGTDSVGKDGADGPPAAAKPPGPPAGEAS